MLLRKADSAKITGTKVLAVKVLNRLIDVPALPEWAEEKLLGLLVDQVVEAFNQTLGKVWKTNKEEKS